MPKEEVLAIDNIFGKPPGWLLNWGITAMTLFLLVCLLISYFVQYPDLLVAQATVSTYNAPVEVVALQSGRLKEVFVKDKQQVREGEILAVLEDASDWRDVIYVDSVLNNKGSLTSLFSKELKLGDLSKVYEDAKSILKQQGQYNSFDITSAQIAAIEKEIKYTQELDKSIQKQIDIQQQELLNIEKDFNRSQKLVRDGVISSTDLEKSENNYLQYKRQLENSKSSRINNSIRIEQLRSQIIGIVKNNREKSGGLSINAEQSIQNLKAAIAEWKKNHLIVASINAMVSLPFSSIQNSSIEAGKVFCTLVPTVMGESKSIAKAKLLPSGTGNLAVGQTAILSFENYPANKFGTLAAVVEDISIIPEETAIGQSSINTYSVTLSLPMEWKTNYGKIIPKQQNLNATVKIKTKEYNLLERLFQNIIEAVRRDS